jgi:magnesium transporter
MQSEMVTVPSDATIRQALQAVVDAAEEIGNVYNVFVVDGDRKLVGVVPLQKLVASRRNDPVAEAIERSIPSVLVDVDQEEVARMFEKYDLVSLPVVDAGNHLFGDHVDDIDDFMERRPRRTCTDRRLHRTTAF